MGPWGPGDVRQPNGRKEPRRPHRDPRDVRLRGENHVLCRRLLDDVCACNKGKSASRAENFLKILNGVLPILWRSRYALFLEPVNADPPLFLSHVPVTKRPAQRASVRLLPLLWAPAESRVGLPARHSCAAGCLLAGRATPQAATWRRGAAPPIASTTINSEWALNSARRGGRRARQARRVRRAGGGAKNLSKLDKHNPIRMKRPRSLGPRL